MYNARSYWRVQKRLRFEFWKVVYPQSVHANGMHASSRFANAHSSAFARNLIHYSIFFPWINSTLRDPLCPMPCCCRQRRRGSHNRLMYGRTAVDLISAVGSFIRCLVLGFCEVRHKRIGEFLRDRAEDKCLFSSEIPMV